MRYRILQFINKSPLVQAIISAMHRIKFRDGQVSLYTIVSIFFQKLRNDEILNRANAVAFSFTLSIFPAIIFLFTLIPIVKPIPDLEIRVMQLLQEWMSPSMFEVVSSTISDILSRPRGGLLSFGFFFSLLLATNGMLSLMRAFNSCYKTVEKRSFFKTFFIAVSLTSMLAVVFILAIALLIIGQVAIRFMTEVGLITDDFLVYVIIITRFVVMFIVFLLAISFIYYFAPAVKYKWRFFSIGSVLASFLSLAISYAFSSYITNFGTYNELYGSIGALIAIMIWQFILSTILLVGYELNASIDTVKVELSKAAE